MLGVALIADDVDRIATCPPSGLTDAERRVVLPPTRDEVIDKVHDDRLGAVGEFDIEALDLFAPPGHQLQKRSRAAANQCAEPSRLDGGVQARIGVPGIGDALEGVEQRRGLAREPILVCSALCGLHQCVSPVLFIGKRHCPQQVILYAVGVEAVREFHKAISESVQVTLFTGSVR